MGFKPISLFRVDFPMDYKLATSGKVRGVFFSLGTTPSDDPNLNCAQAICDLFSSVKKSVKIAIYSLTNPEIADAIIKAHQRGIDVQIVVDLTQSKGKAMNAALVRLQDAGIIVKIAKKQKFCMHNKIAIFDEKIVATGSYNWSVAGSEHNDENLVILEGKKITEQFEKYVFNRIVEYETLKKSPEIKISKY